MSGTRSSTIAISDWLVNCRTEQWTPFEAATALKAALEKEGYIIVVEVGYTIVMKDAVDAEREACAKIAEMPSTGRGITIAEAIRARGTSQESAR